MDQAKSRLVDLEEERCRLQAQVNVMTTDHEELCLKMKLTDEYVQALKQEHKESAKRMESRLVSETKDLSSTIERLHTELQSLKDANNSEEFLNKAKRLEEYVLWKFWIFFMFLSPSFPSNTPGDRRLEILESRLARVSQDYERTRDEKNTEIHRLREEVSQTKSTVSLMEETFEVARSDCKKQKEAITVLEMEIHALRNEKQRAEASLEMAQDDNQTLLEQVKRYPLSRFRVDRSHLTCSLEANALDSEKLVSMEQELSRMKQENEKLQAVWGELILLGCVTRGLVAQIERGRETSGGFGPTLEGEGDQTQDGTRSYSCGYTCPSKV